MAGIFNLIAILTEECDTGTAVPANIYKSNPDLPPEAFDTMSNILSGGKYPFLENDGGIFENRPVVGEMEPRLPIQPNGYYKEYTVINPKVYPNRGALRIVVGSNGEMFYTPDHYKTFIPIIK